MYDFPEPFFPKEMKRKQKKVVNFNENLKPQIVPFDPVLVFNRTCADHNQKATLSISKKTERKSLHSIQIGSFRPLIIHHRMIINYGIELEKIDGRRKEKVWVKTIDLEKKKFFGGYIAAKWKAYKLFYKRSFESLISF